MDRDNPSRSSTSPSGGACAPYRARHRRSTAHLSRRRGLTVSAVVAVLAVLGVPLARVQAPAPAAVGDVVVAAFSDAQTSSIDMTSSTNVRIKQVYDVAASLGAEYATDAGDLSVYGTYDVYDVVYGALYQGHWQDKFLPVPGNHDHTVTDAAEFARYFGPKVGRAGHLYYARDIGSYWRLYALDTDGPITEQVTWLKADLAANPGRHVFAMWHKPRYSIGSHGNNTVSQPFIDALTATGRLKFVLNGHDHSYQRWDLGTYQEFVVATGGGSFTTFPTSDSRVRASDRSNYGAEKLVLHADGTYSGEEHFLGGAVFDAGTWGTKTPLPTPTTTTPSPTPTTPTPRPTTTATPATLTFPAVADSTVAKRDSTTNFGAAPRLVVDRNPVNDALMRFTVSGTAGLAITKAQLLLTVGTSSGDGSSVGGDLYRTGTGWAESTVTWQNAPASMGTQLAQLGPAPAGSTLAADVTSQVTGDGAFAFRLVTSSVDAVRYLSREASTTNGPRLVVTTGKASSPAPTPTKTTTGLPTAALQDLVSSVANVPATAVYHLRDSAGVSMDSLKVARDSGGSYVGVYHSCATNPCSVRIATSTDLRSWTYRHALAGGSQPTVQQLPDSSYVVAFESAPGSFVSFLHFSGLSAVLAGSSDASYTAPHTLSTCAEGTPNIYAPHTWNGVASSTLHVGFHYFAGCATDREATGVLRNFSSWSAAPAGAQDDALLAAGLAGKHGDRDAVWHGGQLLTVVEANQTTTFDWAKWRVAVYDFTTSTATVVPVRTAGGSVSFANPAVSAVRDPAGAAVLVVTLFIPTEGAAAGEAGELLFTVPDRLGATPGTLPPSLTASG